MHYETFHSANLYNSYFETFGLNKLLYFKTNLRERLPQMKSSIVSKGEMVNGHIVEPFFCPFIVWLT